MYIGSLIRSCLKPRNFFSVLYYVLNLALIFFLTYYIALFFNPNNGNIAIIVGSSFLAVNLIFTIIMLSPLGERYARFTQGIQSIEQAENPDRIIALFNEVYEKAKINSPKLSDNVKLYYQPENQINASAIGHTTIVVTKGLLSMSDAHIKAILAHEFGHLANSDGDLLLSTFVSNVLLGIIVSIFKVIAFIILAFTGRSDSIIARILNIFVAYIFVQIIELIYGLWTLLGLFMLNISSRKAEYAADAYSAQLGYGKKLAESLKIIDNGQKERFSFASLFYRSHPATEKRIEALKNLS